MGRGRDFSEGSIFGGGIQITLDGGVSARNLVTREVWLSFKIGFVVVKNKSGDIVSVVQN